MLPLSSLPRAAAVGFERGALWMESAPRIATARVRGEIGGGALVKYISAGHGTAARRREVDPQIRIHPLRPRCDHGVARLETQTTGVTEEMLQRRARGSEGFTQFGVTRLEVDRGGHRGEHLGHRGPRTNGVEVSGLEDRAPLAASANERDGGRLTRPLRQARRRIHDDPSTGGV